MILHKNTENYNQHKLVFLLLWNIIQYFHRIGFVKTGERSL